jgi:hypothetical protein
MESLEACEEPLPPDTVLPTLETIQSRFLSISPIADPLLSRTPTSTLKISTLPAGGSDEDYGFLKEGCRANCRR